MPFKKGYKHTEESKEVIRKRMLGNKFGKLLKGIYVDEKASSWKGDNVKYRALHAWVSKHLGKPKKCEHCNSTSAKKYDWALIKGEDYQRKISIWIRLCRSCHIKYDRA